MEKMRQDRRNTVASAFREEIGHAFEPGAKVMSADRELRYSLELQRDRIARRGIQYKDVMDPGKKPTRGLHNVRSWKDGHYETSWSVGYIKHTKTADRNGLKKFKKTESQLIYETVVDVCDGEDVSEDTYCCPNCGAVSSIRELQEGCSHCGTSFQMSELYPKVSNYFLVHDPAVNTDPLWKTVTKYGLRSLPVTLLLFSPMIWLDSNFSLLKGFNLADHIVVPSPAKVIAYIFAMIILSPVIGYFVWMLSLFFAGFRAIGKETPVALSVGSSRKRFAAKMSTISPEYTFEKFSSRITSLFKIAIFSDSRETLPFYAAGDLGKNFDNVVDCTYRGWMSCKKIKEQNNIVYVTGDVFVDATHDMGDRLKVKNEVYQITAGRRTDVLFTTDFSIAKIQCPSCGASFNSFKSRKCPYCGVECEPATDDWVIYDIRDVGKKFLIKKILWGLLIIALLVTALITAYKTILP